MEHVHGNISHAMRDNYNEYGVDEYYRKVAETYRNPFFPGIKKVVWTLLNRWWEEEGREIYASESESHEDVGGLRILDMAAGSGEATLCILEWEATARGAPAIPTNPSGLIRTTPNIPSANSSRPAFIPPNARNRQLQSPSTPTPSGGNRSKQTVFGASSPPILPESFPPISIVATDPFTVPAYTNRTSRPCHPLSFSDLASGQIPPEPDCKPVKNGIIWDIIICSFALHLVPPQELFPLCYELSRKARWLVVVAPHKKPELKDTWGFERWDIAAWKPAGEKLYSHVGNGEAEAESELEIIRDKVKLRLYRSTNV